MFAREFRWRGLHDIRFRLSRFLLIGVIVVVHVATFLHSHTYYYCYFLHCCEWYSRLRTHISRRLTFRVGLVVLLLIFSHLYYFGDFRVLLMIWSFTLFWPKNAWLSFGFLLYVYRGSLDANDFSFRLWLATLVFSYSSRFRVNK